MEIQEAFPGALRRIIGPQKEPEKLAGGFGGVDGPAEGPVWWKEGGYLLFSDIHNSRRMKWEPGRGISIDAEDTKAANGMTRDQQGRLVSCHLFTRNVTRIEPDGSTTVVANNYRGHRLNRPNDVVVKSDGSIYFSDPLPGSRGAPWEADLEIASFNRVSPDLGEVSQIARDFHSPNGLCFSPDEKLLYLNDSRPRQIRVLEVGPDGTLDETSAPARLFFQMPGDEPGRRIGGRPNGMKVDVEGNLYCTGPGGIWIISPEGQHLGTIPYVGESSDSLSTGALDATNMAWGDDDWMTLYFTAWDSLHRIRLGLPGIPVPRGKL